MKKLVLSLLLLGSLAYVQAQEYETIFGGEDAFAISGFGGPFMHFTSIDGKFAHMMGGGGGAIINQRFYIGGAGYGTTNRIELHGEATTDYDYLEFGYGGVLLGYFIRPERAIHPSVSLLVGWGGVGLDSDEDVYSSGPSEGVFVLNPTAEVEFNITSFFKIGVGVMYQQVFGVDDFQGYSDSDFSSPGGTLAFRFGWFGS